MERDPDKPLVIGEGIETSASAALIINAPAWAAVSAGNLGYRLVLPDEVNKVIISVDPDLPGRKAAWAACARWRQEGRDVKLALPSGSGDFNDYLCALKKDATHD